jgi:hypothetical protein
MEIPMKHLSLAAICAALLVLSGCVAYPIDSYPARGGQSAEHDRDRGRDHNDNRGGERRDDNGPRGQN